MRKRPKRKKGSLRRAKSKKTKKSSKTKKKSYKRGSLIKSIYAYFDEEGIDNVDYETTKKLALSIKPDTKFNKYHYAWYRNDYKNRRDI